MIFKISLQGEQRMGILSSFLKDIFFLILNLSACTRGPGLQQWGPEEQLGGTRLVKVGGHVLYSPAAAVIS